MPAHHGMNDFGGLAAYCRPSHTRRRSDRFGRLCSDLAPLYTDPAILREVGKPTGAMDGGTGNDRTQSVAVGMVFFGQFVDHDITLDVSSSFDTVNDPDGIANARTPTLDLDAIYGGGPEASPYLYHRSGPFGGVKLVTGAETGGHAVADHDLPRVRANTPDLDGVALIGDPRNDENRIISQIHLAMLRVHNKMVDVIAARPNPPTGHDLYEEARQTVTWNYQWNVVHDFLTAMCGAGVVNRVLSEGRRVYRPDEPFIPVEFAVAGFRFGHSMVPQEIQVRTGKSPLALFGPSLGAGFVPVPGPTAVVDMHEIFFTHEGRNVERAQRMDTKLARTLLDLPFITSGETSLATRNLLRGQSFLLPSGETFARAVGRPDAEIAQVSAAVDTATAGALTSGTPLWLYFLMEAQIIGREAANGSFEPAEGLGPAAATLVAETIIGLMELDPRSWLGTDRSWEPDRTLPPAEQLEGIGNMLSWAQPALPAV
jgi:hypothetical protein